MNLCNTELSAALSDTLIRPAAQAVGAPAPYAQVAFHGRVVMLGFGCIAQGVLPLLLRHIAMPASDILVIAPASADQPMAQASGVAYLPLALTPETLHSVLEAQLAPGDLLLNLSVGVSSLALIALCRARGALYLDTCIEPWEGAHLDGTQALATRTNYAQREAALALRSPARNGPTAVLTHGANPGLVSYFLKQALLDIARDLGYAVDVPQTRHAWARLACILDVRVVHVAECDTQEAAQRKRPGEFVNTWSVEAFAEEACQPAELGWGSHELQFPTDGARHAAGCGAAIYLRRPGASTRVRSWTPTTGPMQGFLVTHAESISIADHFTLEREGKLIYRPTVHYAYRPCEDAILSLHELAERNWRLQPRERVLKDDITQGVDALGVLVMGHERNAYWYGSRLSIDEARALCPHNSATSLQVTAAVMAGAVWAIQNPARDVVEPDDLPFDTLLALCRPYLGQLGGVYADWTPLKGRNTLFAEDLDRSDPWQFRNFRVA